MKYLLRRAYFFCFLVSVAGCKEAPVDVSDKSQDPPSIVSFLDCPDNSGLYRCGKDFNDVKIEFTWTESNGLRTYSLAGGAVPDGKPRTLKHKNTLNGFSVDYSETVTASCAGKTLNIDVETANDSHFLEIVSKTKYSFDESGNLNVSVSTGSSIDHLNTISDICTLAQ